MATAARQTTSSVGFRSLDEEVHLDSVPVTGTVPAWLTGTLVRVTPALMDGGGKSVKHWFDGAAMLNAFGFGAVICFRALHNLLELFGRFAEFLLKQLVEGQRRVRGQLLCEDVLLIGQLLLFLWSWSLLFRG